MVQVYVYNTRFPESNVESSKIDSDISITVGDVTVSYIVDVSITLLYNVRTPCPKKQQHNPRTISRPVNTPASRDGIFEAMKHLGFEGDAII